MRPLSRVLADFAAGFLLVGAACHTHGQGAVGPLLTTSVVASGATMADRPQANGEQEFLPAVSALESSHSRGVPSSLLLMRGREDGHPAGLITRRSAVRIRPALPSSSEAAGPASATNPRTTGPAVGAAAETEAKGVAPADSGAASAVSPLTVELRVGGLVVFGDGAPAGTAPFADLRTVTRLSTSPRPWRLTTQTQLSAAPGAEFDVSSAETWQTLDFAVGLGVPLRASWNVSLYLEAGAQARVFMADAIDPPDARRVGAGVLVESTSAAHLALILAYDERLHGFGALIGASVDVAPSLGFVGSALVGRSSVTLKLAAVVKWAPK